MSKGKIFNYVKDVSLPIGVFDSPIACVNGSISKFGSLAIIRETVEVSSTPSVSVTMHCNEKYILK